MKTAQVSSCLSPSAAGWAPSRPWLWGPSANPGPRPPWRDMRRECDREEVLVGMRVTHTCRWGHSHNSKHGQCMLSQYFSSSSLMPEIPADHIRHIWEVPEREELKKCTFRGNHKAHILIQFPLTLYSCVVFLYIVKSFPSTYFYILFASSGTALWNSS